MRVRYILLACTTYIFAAIDFFSNYGFPIYPFGFVFVMMSFVILLYGITMHGVMDIQIVVRKTIVFSSLTGITAAIMVVAAMASARFAGGYGDRGGFVLVVAACLITIVFHPLQLKIQDVVDRFLFRDWADKPVAREIAAGFSHELKSPLAGLSVHIERALMDVHDLEAGKKGLHEALPKLKGDLESLLAKTMDAARRIEAVEGVAGKRMIGSEPVDLTSIMKKSLESIARRQAELDLVIKQDIPANLPTVSADAKQLEIVFLNLLKNALDAMEAGDGKRQLRISVLERNGYVEMVVADTGPGIATKDLDRIFEPYFTTKGRKGTGMGLYLARQIVKTHGGTIEARSELGKGSEFLVRLPVNGAAA